MGNIVQCCQLLLSLLKCVETPGLGETEGSPLLCSEGSECDSADLTDSWEDDVATLSTSVTNLTLDAEHFLFPDIVFGSHDSEEGTLVDPMVCLLVSEEEVVVVGNEGSKVDGQTQDSSQVKIFTMSSNQLDSHPGPHSAEAQRDLDVTTTCLSASHNDDVTPDVETTLGDTRSSSETKTDVRLNISSV